MQHVLYDLGGVMGSRPMPTVPLSDAELEDTLGRKKETEPKLQRMTAQQFVEWYLAEKCEPEFREWYLLRQRVK